MKEYPSQEYLKSILNYDPDTGVFTWKERPELPKSWNSRYANKKAGDKNLQTGYSFITIDYGRYRAHRLAMIYHYGHCKCGEVDHINGDRSDNRIANLRFGDKHQNTKNVAKNSKNTSGVVGVSWDKRRSNWVAYINSEKGKRKFLGQFADFEEACKVRWAAEIKYGYHPNHGKR